MCHFKVMFTIFQRKCHNGRQCQPSQFQKKKHSKSMSQKRQLESFEKYRDSVVWRLLRMENHLGKNKLTTYWKLMDTMMNLSLKSAITLLQKRYGYRVRHLHQNTRQKGVSGKCYRLENRNRGEYREVSTNVLLRKTIELLRDEIKSLG